MFQMGMRTVEFINNKMYCDDKGCLMRMSIKSRIWNVAFGANPYMSEVKNRRWAYYEFKMKKERILSVQEVYLRLNLTLTVI